MYILEAILSAVKAIWSAKMRSLLTMLGIIIGIFAVTALISVGQSTNAEIKETIENLGSNLITVNIFDSRMDIDMDKVNDMRNLQGIKEVSPYISSTDTVKYKEATMDVKIEGIMPSYLEIRSREIMDDGRGFYQLDVEDRKRTAIVGTEVAQELFGSYDCINEEIMINGTSFTIIGILEGKGSTGGTSEDETIMIPFTTAQRYMKNNEIKVIYISAESSETVDTALTSLDDYLLPLANNLDTGYRVSSQTTILESLDDVTASQTAMLGGIAAISLLVGGIGIMNIMLVSVTERTREIGVRKAIGASRRDILVQFLIEAIIISILGGIIGVMLAQFGSQFIGILMDQTIVVESAVMFASLGFSVLIGVGFGFYPAVKASALRPIEALRYE